MTGMFQMICHITGVLMTKELADIQKQIRQIKQSIRSLEEGQVEIHERIDNSNISKNTLERKVDTFINKFK